MAQGPAHEASGCLGDGEPPQRIGGYGHKDVPKGPWLVRRGGGRVPGVPEEGSEEPEDARVLALVSEPQKYSSIHGSRAMVAFIGLEVCTDVFSSYVVYAQKPEDA